jgi:hypothetical protein
LSRGIGERNCAEGIQTTILDHVATTAKEHEVGANVVSGIAIDVVSLDCICSAVGLAWSEVREHSPSSLALCCGQSFILFPRVVITASNGLFFGHTHRYQPISQSGLISSTRSTRMVEQGRSCRAPVMALRGHHCL